jgi:murein DD-endopeptidase MepM/ murein hydrolase activator NlpD
MILNRLVALVIFCAFANDSVGQFFTPKKYAKNYFDWPVAATKGLVANFGELRPNHYHMGLDCRTDQKQNLPVLAAAAGYIAKVKIEPFGFGRAIYINHPNGLTTLYAHLNNFNPALEKYVTEQQYKLKSWNVFLDIPSNLFPVTKGMFIAYSGNTGGSQGPHVHFEIRDTKTDKVLNPSLFGFPIPDNVPPKILRLAVYDRCISTYEQNPKLYSIKKVNGVYVTVPALININTDEVSFGISATDSYTGSSNPNGIYEAVIYDNEQPVTGFQLDSISYDETRYLNAHIDYKLRSSGGPFVQHLSKLPGYLNSIYKTTYGDGVIALEDDSSHKIKIAVKDADGNTSLLQFEIKRSPNVFSKPKRDSTNFFKPKMFHPGFINLFENSNISFYLPENALYDSIRFRYSETATATGFPIYQLHNASVPVQTYFPVKIKAASALPDKMVMHRFAGGKNDYTKATYENGWYKASFRAFGNFQLVLDTVAPTITPVGFKDGMNAAKLSAIKFVVLDNTEEIINFTATLDGNWLRFNNDKGRTFVYIFDEHCAAGEHELKIVAEDQVGNVTEKIYHFTR